MKAGNIFILSQPIHSGKTTVLMNWLERQSNAAGILTPDINGKRKLYDIAQKTYDDLEVDADHPMNKTVVIGKYYFNKAIFDKAQQILLNTLSKTYGWVIVDEIGRLELDQHRGLEPAVSKVIEHYKHHETNGRLLLVVRDYLLNNCLKHYQLNEAVVVNKTNFDE